MIEEALAGKPVGPITGNSSPPPAAHADAQPPPIDPTQRIARIVPPPPQPGADAA